MMCQKILCLLLLIACLSCGSVTHSQQKRGSGKTNEPIIVGVAWPFSVKNDQFRDGVTMAVKDINEAGGVLGRPFEMVFADDGGKANQGEVVAQQFVEHSDMVAVLGHYHAHIAEPASLTYEYSGLLMMTPGATHPKLMQQGFQRIFRTIPNDNQIGGQLADIARQRGFKRAVIIHEQSNYGRQLANAIEFRCEEIQVTIADRLSYDTGIDDYRLMFSRLQLLDCDAIFFAGLGSDAAAIISAAREQGFQQPFLGGNGLDTPDLFVKGAEAVEGTYVLSVFDSRNPNPYVQDFNRRFDAMFQNQPDAWAAQGYDTVQLLARGIRGAQSTEPSDIAGAMRNIRGWYGVTGRHDFDNQGEIHNKPMVMKVARNGKLDFINF